MIRALLHSKVRWLFIAGVIAISAFSATACGLDGGSTAVASVTPMSAVADTRVPAVVVPTSAATATAVVPTSAATATAVVPMSAATATVVVPTSAATATVVVPTSAATATVVVVPTVVPTVATLATSSVVAESSLVDAEDVASLSARAYDLTIMLAEDVSPRQSATEEELRGAMFLLEEMTELGYVVEIQDFEVWDISPSGSLEVLPLSDGGEPSVSFSRRDGDTPRIFFLPFEPLKSGQIRGEMVFAGFGDDDDFEGIDVEGKIVVMERGALLFEDKETNAADRGAIGLVVFNNEPPFYFGGRLAQEPEIFAGGVPLDDGMILREALEDGKSVSAEILVYPNGDGRSRNVIAELNNDISGDQVVVIGAHYDTTPWTQGANDNGSGVATALIVAEELSDIELPFDVRFVFFGSEETGLHGSFYYANDLLASEVARIEAMINLDVVATGELHAFGDDLLTEYADGVGEVLDVDLKITEPFDWGASDYLGFDERDVPYLMLYADDLRYINHPSDTIEHVDAAALGGTVAIVLGVIERMADGIGR